MIYIILLHTIYIIQKIAQKHCAISCDVSLILISKSVSNRLISQYTKVF